MNMTGEQLIRATQATTWAALNDPEILKRCIPGCESIEQTSPDEFRVLMVARIGAVSAKFNGKLTLADVVAPTSYMIVFEGQGGTAGFGKGTAKVQLSAEGESTKLYYEANATVGGRIAQVGSRLVDSAAKKIAEDFFKAFNECVQQTSAPQQFSDSVVNARAPEKITQGAEEAADRGQSTRLVDSGRWGKPLFTLALVGGIILIIGLALSLYSQ